MDKFFLRFLFFTTLLLPNLSFAAVDLELTQGVYGSMPIVFSISGSKSIAENKVATDLTAGVRHFLSLSGEFKLIKGEDVIPTLDLLADYQKKGITYVSYANLEKNSIEDSYSLSLLLYDLVSDQNLDFTKPKKIIKYNFKKEDINDFSATLSDDIYKSITDYPGVFSTQLAYVVVQKKQGMSPLYSLRVSNFDGSNQSTILQSYEPIMSPSWSHDGTKLAYVSFEGKQSGIFVQEVSTGIRKKVSDVNGVNGSPSWTQDDQALAVVLSEEEFTKIYKVDINTLSQEPLTQGNSIDTEPSWSSDNNYLFFTSNRGGRPHIYRYDLKSEHVDRVTFKGDYNASSDVSNDNKFIVYLHRDGGLFSLATQNLESGTVRVISHDQYEESPVFAPNGRIIAYASKYGARGVLGFVSLDGMIKWRLPVANGDVQEPAWSPLLNHRSKYLIDETII